MPFQCSRLNVNFLQTNCYRFANKMSPYKPPAPLLCTLSDLTTFWLWWGPSGSAQTILSHSGCHHFSLYFIVLWTQAALKLTVSLWKHLPAFYLQPQSPACSLPWEVYALWIYCNSCIQAHRFQIKKECMCGSWLWICVQSLLVSEGQLWSRLRCLLSVLPQPHHLTPFSMQYGADSEIWNTIAIIVIGEKFRKIG